MTHSANARRSSPLVAAIARFYLALTSVRGFSFGNLARLSDAHLADLGLTRFDVPRAAAADILSR